MTTQRPPGTDAARHGSGDADLTLMISAHRAFARHLVSLAPGRQASEPGQPRATPGGRQRLARVQAPAAYAPPQRRPAHLVGIAQAAGQQRQRPVRARRDGGRARAYRSAAPCRRPALADPAHDRLADAIDALATTLTSHLAHEETDRASPDRHRPHRRRMESGRTADRLNQWLVRRRGVLRLDARWRPARPGLGRVRRVAPAARVLCRAAWKPRYAKVSHRRTRPPPSEKPGARSRPATPNR